MLQEETKQALSVHKAHLACLVARCAMVSRWAGDPTVQAAMVSCLPSHLAKVCAVAYSIVACLSTAWWWRLVTCLYQLHPHQGHKRGLTLLSAVIVVAV